MTTRFLFAATLALAAASASAQLVDFEDVDGSGNPIVTDVASGGFRFTSDHFHAISNPEGFGGSGNESRTWIGHEGGDLGRAITMTRASGGLFDLHSFDGAELWINSNSSYPNASEIEVVGTRADGSTVTQRVRLDGIVDGRGGRADFQAFDLRGFTGLRAATFNGLLEGRASYAFAVDNINTVPAPAGAVLLGLAGATARRRRR